MKAKSYLKEIYPIALFFLVLMSWATIGASDQQPKSNSSMAWSWLLQSKSETDACKNTEALFLHDPACKKGQEINASSLAYNSKKKPSFGIQ